MVTSVNPRTREAYGSLADTTPEQVEQVVTLASEAFEALSDKPRRWRADLLGAIAESLESAGDQIVEAAVAESGLGEARLRGELGRSAFQFRLFAEAVLEGSYLEAAIDRAGMTPMGPGPEIRRMLHPIGPIAVFGASNFPLAFSVPGGDTASALAAGCPVVVKAHSSHPITAQRCFEAIRAALARVGGPEGAIGIVYGTEAGRALVVDPRIRAVGFTGSLSGGKALMHLINTQRDEPIPFYGELSSLNPLVITEGAALERASDIAQGLFASVTGSAGQLCTKPGVAFVPATAAGDALVEELKRLTEQAESQVLLNGRIHESYGSYLHRLESMSGSAVSLVGGAPGADNEGFWAVPTVASVAAGDLTDELTEECFGPFVLVVRYEQLSDVTDALARVPRSLTGTVHHADSEGKAVSELTRVLFPRSGRLIFNGYPTGVRVSWAQHHGGPWPATNSIHTSVGVTAMRRFLRPVAWQDAPEAVLPEELRDGFDEIPRRIDGELRLP